MYDSKLQAFVFYKSRAVNRLISLILFLTNLIVILPLFLVFWGAGVYFLAVPFGGYLVFCVMAQIVIYKRNKENLPALIVNEKGIDILNKGYFEWKDIEKIAVYPIEYCCLIFKFKEEIMPLEVRDEFSFGRVRHRPMESVLFRMNTPQEFKECIEIVSRFHPVEQRKSHKLKGRLMIASDVKKGEFKINGKRDI